MTELMLKAYYDKLYELATYNRQKQLHAAQAQQGRIIDIEVRQRNTLMVEPSEDLKLVFEKAIKDAKNLKHEYVTVEHLLFSIIF